MFGLCHVRVICFFVFFFKQKTAYEMRISDWSSDVCSSDLDSEALNPPVPEPHVLIVGSALRSEASDLIEISLRRMGLQPKRIGGHEEKDGAAAFRIALGQAIATIDRPGDAALAAADPADRGTEEHTSELQSLMRLSYAVL